MIPRKQPLHRHRNFGIPPMMEDVRESGRALFAWLVFVIAVAMFASVGIVIWRIAGMVYAYA